VISFFLSRSGAPWTFSLALSSNRPWKSFRQPFSEPEGYAVQSSSAAPVSQYSLSPSCLATNRRRQVRPSRRRDCNCKAGKKGQAPLHQRPQILGRGPVRLHVLTAYPLPFRKILHTYTTLTIAKSHTSRPCYSFLRSINPPFKTLKT